MATVEERFKRIKRLKAEYGFTDSPYMPEIPRQSSKPKKKKKKVTVPSGVRTPAQIKEFKEIMGWD